MKTRITIDLNHHGATSALRRLLTLLDWARDGYGITSLTYKVEDDDG